MKQAGKIAALFAVLLTLLASSRMEAEEIIIEEGKHANVGDFHCHPCFEKLGSNALVLTAPIGDRPIEMTAGELWEYFHSHGFDSVNELSLFVEIDQLDSNAQYNLSSLNFQIEATDGDVLTDLDLGGSNLVVPGYETSSFRPEAHLSFDLGYDFMQEFSKDSTELVRFNIQSGSGVTPTFLISPKNEVFTSNHLSSLFTFVLFWGFVFLAVFHFMKPASIKKVASSLEAQSEEAISIGPQQPEPAATVSLNNDRPSSPAIATNAPARAT